MPDQFDAAIDALFTEPPGTVMDAETGEILSRPAPSEGMGDEPYVYDPECPGDGTPQMCKRRDCPCDIDLGPHAPDC